MSESNAVSVRAERVRNVIESKWPELQKSLPSHVTPGRYLRVLQNALGKNPKLLECTPISLISAITVASELGLEINTPLGLGYVIPYENKRQNCIEAQFQIGYKGVIELAYRSGRVRSIAAEIVYKNDTFRRSLGLHRDLVHEPALGERGEIIGYYATVSVEGIDPHFDFMTKQEAYDHGSRYSKSFKYDIEYGKRSSVWSTNFDAMALKTIILKALKFTPKAIEDVLMRRAMDTEETDFDPIETTATTSTSPAEDQTEVVEVQASPRGAAPAEEAVSEAVERAFQEAGFSKAKRAAILKSATANGWDEAQLITQINIKSGAEDRNQGSARRDVTTTRRHRKDEAEPAPAPRRSAAPTAAAAVVTPGDDDGDDF